MFKQLFLEEKNMMIAVALNSLVIFFLYFPQIRLDHESVYWTLEYIDLIFVIIFLVEAIVKIQHYGFKGYISDNWNKFDLLIVVVSLPALFTFIPFFSGHDTSFLKILRLGRMIRLIRFMSFVPRMELIVAGLSRALKASVFVMIALIFLNFILALFTCHFYGKTAPDYFSDPAISMYYIFQLFTVEGWNEIPQIVIEEHQSLNEDTVNPIFAGATRFYFILVVLMGGIFGMSLANAVFVDEMTSDNNKDVENKLEEMKNQIAELKELIERKG